MKDLVPCVLFERWGFTLLVFLLRWYGNPTFQLEERESGWGGGGLVFNETGEEGLYDGDLNGGVMALYSF